MASTKDLSLAHIAFENEDPQTQSALFQLPAEVRDYIYSFTLAAYEDDDRKYDVHTYWCRPGDLAPRRSDTALLRTCKKAYHETWFKPWAFADHTFWLTGNDRKPGRTMDRDAFAKAIDLIQKDYGDVEIENVRFFAQMYMLEPADNLSGYLNLPHFHPRSITITIRHTDWWCWEDDERLHIQAKWVNECRFPVSTRVFKMELESLERKKDQIDSIVQRMRDEWYFTKTDGSLMFAKNTDVDIWKWKGTSTWNGERWVRDESEPETINYYVAIVVWQNEPTSLQSGMTKPRDLQATTNSQVIASPNAKIRVVDLKNAEVPPGAKADEAIRLVQEYYTRVPTERQRVIRRGVRRFLPPYNGRD